MPVYMVLFSLIRFLSFLVTQEKEKIKTKTKTFGSMEETGQRWQHCCPKTQVPLIKLTWLVQYSNWHAAQTIR